MRIFLYSVWFAIPLFFFTVALWSRLEQMGGRSKRQNPGDFLRQGMFVLACVVIAVLVDSYMLEGPVSTLSPDFIPLEFYQIILLPVILYAGAKLLGPTKAIRIAKAPRPSQRTPGR